MIRRLLREFRRQRFFYQEEENIPVRAYWKDDDYCGDKQKLGKAKGITLYQPRNSVKKYPYIDYTMLECVRWTGGRFSRCLEAVGYLPIGSVIYWVVRWIPRRGYDTSEGFVGLVQPGEMVEFNFYTSYTGDKYIGIVENCRKIIDTYEVRDNPTLRSELSMYAVKKGWSIAKNSPEENLLAVWCEKNGILSVLEEEPSTQALSFEEREKMEMTEE